MEERNIERSDIMDNNLRRELMYNAVIGLKKESNIIDLRDGKYSIDHKMKMLIRIKNIILIVVLLPIMLGYLYIMDKGFGMSIDLASENDFKNALILTLIFMLVVGLIVFIIPRFLIPQDLSTFKIEKIKGKRRS